MPPPTALRIGTRGSALALTQSNWVAARLREAHAGLQVELVRIQTKGDKIRDVALSRVGGKGLFVKEIENALLAGEVDIAVHSMKDLPTELPAGLCLAAVPVREDARDALIVRAGLDCDRADEELPLPKGAAVGTSSLRRQAQLLHLRPDLQVVDLRGNVDTRLRKLDEGRYDAILLAAAGLRRLGHAGRISELLDPPSWLPAVGQGALALEGRTGDQATLELVCPLHHPTVAACVAAERSLLGRLEGGCQVPLGAHTEVADGRVHLTGFVASPDGRQFVSGAAAESLCDAESAGTRLAENLLENGGREILRALREG